MQLNSSLHFLQRLLLLPLLVAIQVLIIKKTSLLFIQHVYNSYLIDSSMLIFVIFVVFIWFYCELVFFMLF